MTDISRDLIPLSDDELEELFEEHASICLSAEEDLCFGPASEIDNFREGRKSWARPGEVAEDSDGVFVVYNAAAQKGQARRTVALIRVGDYCAITGMDQ